MMVNLSFPGSTVNELSEQIDWTPPSLYLFDPGNEPWADLGTVTDLQD